MILKENYFDDIEITDDDLKYPIDDFNTFNTDETYANPKEWFNSMKSEYTHCMSFDIEYADIGYAWWWVDLVDDDGIVFED